MKNILLLLFILLSINAKSQTTRYAIDSATKDTMQFMSVILWDNGKDSMIIKTNAVKTRGGKINQGGRIIMENKLITGQEYIDCKKDPYAARSKKLRMSLIK